MVGNIVFRGEEIPSSSFRGEEEFFLNSCCALCLLHILPCSRSGRRDVICARVFVWCESDLRVRPGFFLGDIASWLLVTFRQNEHTELSKTKPSNWKSSALVRVSSIQTLLSCPDHPGPSRNLCPQLESSTIKPSTRASFPGSCWRTGSTSGPISAGGDTASDSLFRLRSLDRPTSPLFWRRVSPLRCLRSPNMTPPGLEPLDHLPGLEK